MPTRAKSISRTDYAVRRLDDGRYWTERGAWMSFARAKLWPERPRISDFPGCEIVPVRCRALSPRAKASKKRTRDVTR